MPDYSLMIVDDQETDRYILKRLLKSGGIDVPLFEYADGLAAMEFLRDYEANRAQHGDRFPPLIVFLDINMPRMNGFEFLEAFSALSKEQGDYESVVFLMVTSSDNAADQQRAQSFGCVKGYINKMPGSGEELRAAVEAYLPQ